MKHQQHFMESLCFWVFVSVAENLGEKLQQLKIRNLSLTVTGSRLELPGEYLLR